LIAQVAVAYILMLMYVVWTPAVPDWDCAGKSTYLPLNFCMLKFKVSAKIIVSDQLKSIFSGMPEI
jgi:hypothetical protein